MASTWRIVNGFRLAPWASAADIEYAETHGVSSTSSAASQNWGADTHVTPTPTVAPVVTPTVTPIATAAQTAATLTAMGEHITPTSTAVQNRDEQYAPAITTGSTNVTTATQNRDEQYAPAAAPTTVTPSAVQNRDEQYAPATVTTSTAAQNRDEQYAPTQTVGVTNVTGSAGTVAQDPWDNYWNMVGSGQGILSGTEDYLGRNATQYGEAVKWATGQGYYATQITLAEIPALSRYVTGSDDATVAWLTDNGYLFDAVTESYYRVASAGGGEGGSGSGGGGSGGGGGDVGGRVGYGSTYGLTNWRIGT